MCRQGPHYSGCLQLSTQLTFVPSQEHRTTDQNITSSHSKQSLARFAEKKEAVQPSSWMDARYPIRSPLH